MRPSQHDHPAYKRFYVEDYKETIINHQTKSLDLGCGLRPKNFFKAEVVFGIDNRQDLKQRVHNVDLVLKPIPFPDHYFDYVTAHDFIEHIPRLIYTPTRRMPFVELMNEIWRVLKPKGRFLSQTPAYPQVAAFSDPTHVNIITEQTFPVYFCDPLWAKPYGFNGRFKMVLQQWSGPHLVSVLESTSTELASESQVEIAF
jgi:SAM-dependent methyltransferase